MPPRRHLLLPLLAVAMLGGSITEQAGATGISDPDATVAKKKCRKKKKCKKTTQPVAPAPAPAPVGGGSSTGTTPAPPAPPANTAPSLVTATANGTSLALTFNEPLGSAPTAGSFAVHVSGGSRSVQSVSLGGNVLTLTLAEQVWSDDKVTVDVPAVQDTAGATASPQAGVAVSNLTAAAGFSPALSFPSFVNNSTGGNISPHVGVWPVLLDRFRSSLGEYKTVLIPIDFPDVQYQPGTDPTAADYRTLLSGASHDWYDEASYGRMDFQMAGPDTWFTMSQNSDAYGSRGSSAQAAAIFQEAVALADPSVDFSQYDAVWMVAPPDSITNLSFALYRPWPGQGVVADGTDLSGVVGHGGYAIYEPFVDRYVHAFVTHENGHLMGLPDLYGRLCPTCAETHDFWGGWDLMDRPQAPAPHFNAWFKWMLRWLDADDLRGLAVPGERTATLSPIETAGGVKGLAVLASDSKVYVAEVRKQTGEDDDICEEGVLIYSLDSTVPNGSGPGLMYTDEASSDSGLVTQCGEKYAAPFDVGDTFTDAGAGISFEIQSKTGDDYTVRATKSP